MALIEKLPDHLIDKIAAGEVVESPASVLKEIIENSLDAGARTLEIAIERAGMRLLSLTDNGEGIPSDQVRLAFARHATSKIKGEDDLRAIGSYGFRGEALPAIAAVSIVELISAVAGSSEGAKIVIEGGNVVSFEAAPPRQGTTIIIRQLFFNTPARRKFLKSETAELRRITAIFTKYAVACHEVGFSLVSEGREIANYPAGDSLLQRLERVWGERVSGRLLDIDTNHADGVRIHGLVSHPGTNRGNRSQMYLIVNRRPINDVSLLHAIRSGYGNTLDAGFFPLAAVFIELDHSLVDVNVHPAKTEVRFANDKYLYSQIRKLIEAAVQVPALFSVQSASGGESNVRGVIKRAFVDSRTIDRHEQFETPPIRPARPIESTGKGDFGDEVYQQVPAEAERELELGGERFWQLYNTFVMGFREGKIWMIDQHTAHERVLYEAALNNLYERPGISQRLLFDLTVELDLQEMAVFEKHAPLFRKLGFEIEPFGDRAVIIRGVPGYFESSAIESITRNLLGQFADNLSTGEDPIMALASSLACHAAIKAGEQLTQDQMQGLFNRLFECQEPYRCPHGRPTVITISREDLEKIFKRR